MGKVTSTTRSKPGPVIVASVLGAGLQQPVPRTGATPPKAEVRRAWAD
jgi:hypothetical protein